MRQSIQPTYDSRETGPRFSVEYFVNGRSIDKTPISDPFLRGTVTVSWRDLLASLLKRKRLTVEVQVRGDHQIEEDVMELDGDYLGGHDCTRRAAFRAQLETSLHDFSYVCPD